VSIHTSQDLAAEEDRHRPSLQTAVDELGELVERFRALTFDGRDHFFQHIVANIPPITRARSNVVGRGRTTAGAASTQTGDEAQQDTRRYQDTLGNVATTEGPVWQPVL